MNNCDLYADNLLACVWDAIQFVKRFALRYRTVVLSVCHVCNVGALWRKGWMDEDET